MAPSSKVLAHLARVQGTLNPSPYAPQIGQQFETKRQTNTSISDQIAAKQNEDRARTDWLDSHTDSLNQVLEKLERRNTDFLSRHQDELERPPTKEDYQKLQLRCQKADQQLREQTLAHQKAAQQNLANQEALAKSMDMETAYENTLVDLEDQADLMEVMHRDETSALQSQLTGLRDEAKCEAALCQSSEHQLDCMRTAMRERYAFIDREYVDEVEDHKTTKRAKIAAQTDASSAKQDLDAANDLLVETKSALQALQTRHDALAQDYKRAVEDLQECRRSLETAYQTLGSNAEATTSLQQENHELRI